MTDLKNNLEEVWNEEYKNFMLSFYPESSPLVSTWEIYRMAKIKSQKEIKNLLELTETLNQIRDNLQDENRKLEQELQKTREQLDKAEKVIEFYGDINNWTGEDINGWNCTNVISQCDQEILETVWVKGCGTEKDIYDDCGGKRARQYFKDKDKQGE